MAKLIVLILCYLCVLTFPCAFAQPARPHLKGTPQIAIDRDQFDFGKVEEGVKLKETFKITNKGKGVLNIEDAYASCGCTIPKLAKKILQPGETTDLVVVIDTAMKMNKVTKTVFLSSDDPEHPVLKLQLLMDVRDPHVGMTEHEQAKIFTDQHCAACHVAHGVGTFGRTLFLADCAMCHGVKGEGAVGPSLLGPYENFDYKKHVEEVTSFGSKTHRSMPGFLAQAGGPLNKEQIDSLVRYLTDVSEQVKKNRQHE